MKEFLKKVVDIQKGGKPKATVTTKQLIVTSAIVGSIAYLSGNAKAYKNGYVDGVNTLGDRIIKTMKEL